MEDGSDVWHGSYALSLFWREQLAEEAVFLLSLGSTSSFGTNQKEKIEFFLSFPSTKVVRGRMRTGWSEQKYQLKLQKIK